MEQIKFPPFLTVRYAKALIKRCVQAILSKEKKILFDFSICNFSDPFAVTLVVGAMKKCAAKDHTILYSNSQNQKLEEYFRSIGFYKFGSSVVGAGKFAARQVELQHLTAIDPTYTDAVLKVLQNYLHMSQGVKHSLHLSINELMTNTFDHSGITEGCFVCAQAYGERGNVHICLTDFGKGILSALSSSSKYSHLTNSIEAIELAVKEGVSSRVDRMAGLGLTHIQRFLQVNNGEIHIISGDGWIHWNYRDAHGVKVTKKNLEVAFSGTIVNIIARADGEGLYFLSTENPEEQIF